MNFSQLCTGQSAVIRGYLSGQLVYKQRLLAMGLLPGTCFLLVRMAPLGDPIEILVRGCTLTLRKHEADVLQIQVV